MTATVAIGASVAWALVFVVEAGRDGPSPATVARLAAVVGVSVDDAARLVGYRMEPSQMEVVPPTATEDG